MKYIIACLIILFVATIYVKANDTTLLKLIDGNSWDGTPTVYKLNDGDVVCYISRNGYSGGISCLR